jgi:polysaccharide biosynthesis protein PslG
MARTENPPTRFRSKLPAALIFACALGSLILTTPSSVAAVPPPPAGFFGVVPQGALALPAFVRMRGVVETVRLGFNWPQIEPRPNVWDFSTLNAEVGAAASQGIRVMPNLYGVPTWLSDDPIRAPRGDRQTRLWAAFVRRLARRYGPGGDFWAGRPRALPIHRWQVWNEPNFLLFWHPRPQPALYVRLLSATARAIRPVDPQATIVAAGIAPVEGGMRPVDFLRKMYAVPGARRFFDVVAIHPYSYSLAQLAYQVQRIRAVMAAAGDGAKPLQITEIGVASGAVSPTPFALGERGQARFLRRAFGLLLAQRRHWGIAGVDWFSWEDGLSPDPHCPFCQHAGLFSRDGSAKPAWHAYRRLVAKAKLSRGRGVREQR